uniref:Uncharacterized protein n=1 Tax=Cacopsylla melanoneura TaxID=428564 RepID=A0A8D9ABC4_9HEMI
MVIQKMTTCFHSLLVYSQRCSSGMTIRKLMFFDCCLYSRGRSSEMTIRKMVFDCCLLSQERSLGMANRTISFCTPHGDQNLVLLSRLVSTIPFLKCCLPGFWSRSKNYY